jgi:hypothetical protein
VRHKLVVVKKQNMILTQSKIPKTRRVSSPVPCTMQMTKKRIGYMKVWMLRWINDEEHEGAPIYNTFDRLVFADA